jgi:hypothetical protein
MPISGVFWTAGQFFNVCIAIALNSEVFNTKMVVDGWAISRDVANLFFIFILLYIAIATILQLSDYGMKQLLGKIIIIALLVNFSLLITRVIVDSSNILALEFYDSISVEGGATSIMAGKSAKNLSQVFVSGFNPQNLLKSKNFGKTVEEGAGDTLLVVVVSMLLASILVLVAAFVLFAAGILFVIRTVTLWFLMVLAPLAFLAMVLPATRGYANQWWDKLFKQAFFAPVFMFLFYLVAKIIDSGFLNNMVTSIDVGGGVSEGFKKTFSTFAVVSIQFVFLGALMIACLTIAKQMGAAGATIMQSWGQGAKKWGQGYAGRIGKRYTAPVAERLATGTEKTGWGRVVGSGLRKMPLATKGLAKAGTWDKEEIKKYEEQYSSYSPAALANIKASPTLNLLNRTQKQAIENIEKERKKKGEKEAREEAESKLEAGKATPKPKEGVEEEILRTGTSMDKVKILAKREKEAREEAESKLEAGKATPKPKEGVEKT